jgi:hypothetical protein
MMLRSDMYSDRLRWFCPNSKAHPEPHLVREVAFHCTDLGTQLKPFINVSQLIRKLQVSDPTILYPFLIRRVIFNVVWFIGMDGK